MTIANVDLTEKICVWCETRPASTTIDISLSKKTYGGTQYTIGTKVISLPVCDDCKKWHSKMSSQALGGMFKYWGICFLAGAVLFILGLLSHNSSLNLAGLGLVVFGFIPSIFLSIYLESKKPLANEMKYRSIRDIPMVKEAATDGWRLAAM